eukprot:899475-Rhodomonas_salina.1
MMRERKCGSEHETLGAGLDQDRQEKGYTRRTRKESGNRDGPDHTYHGPDSDQVTGQGHTQISG